MFSLIFCRRFAQTITAYDKTLQSNYIPDFSFSFLKRCAIISAKADHAILFRKAMVISMQISRAKSKITALLLATVLPLAAFTACGQEAAESSSQPSSQVSSPGEGTSNSSSGREQPVGNSKDGIVDIFAAGDNILHQAVIDSAETGDGSYDFTKYYQYIARDIENADIAVINQESPLGGETLGIGGYPNFNSPQEIGDNLVSLGFDVITQANNHMMDKGAKGVTETLKYWKKHPDTTVVGINESEADRSRTRIVERNGVKVAFLAYTYGLNGYKLPAGQEYLVNLIDRDAIKEDVERAQAEADAVVVSMHWGVEYSTTTSSTQHSLAQYLADLGVNLVIGHHPHVIQRVSRVKGKNGNETLVFYSLGNFLSSQERSPRMLGAVANVRLEKKDGAVTITQAKITPTVTHFEKGKKDFKIYKLSEYTDELAARHGIHEFDSPFSISSLTSLAKNVLKDWYSEDK